MNNFIRKNRRLLKIYCVVSRIIGWVLLIVPLIGIAWILLESTDNFRGQNLFLMLRWPENIVNVWMLGFIALGIAAFIRYLFETESLPGWTLRHSERILYVGAVLIVVVIGYLVWGMTPEKYYEVSEIMDNPADFDGMEISIKGTVGGWNNTASFIIIDSNDANLTFDATHDRAFPEGFGNNETIVAKGIFTYTNGIGHLESEAIQIGCPSKY